jgi:hypothetical protein
MAQRNIFLPSLLTCLLGLLLTWECETREPALDHWRPPGKLQHAFVQTAGCVPSDRIDSFFQYPQYRMRQPRPETGWDTWDTMWLCNMLDSSVRASGVNFEHVAEGQTVNTFPGVYIETNNKINFCRHIHRAFPESHGVSFHMPCFVLPEDGALLRSNLREKQNFAERRWVTKPEAGSGGKGLQLFSSAQLLQIIDQVEQRAIRVYVQEYLHKTLLLDYDRNLAPPSPGKVTGSSVPTLSALRVKFDFRVYFAITSMRPLRVWVHRYGFSRLATKEFSLKGDHARDLQRHVANVDFQKRQKEFRAPQSNGDDCSAAERSLECVMKEIAVKTGKSVGDVWLAICNVLGKTGLAVQQSIANKARCKGCYQFWGADVVFDDEGNPFMLEINSSPSISFQMMITEGTGLISIYPDLWRLKGVDPLVERANCNLKNISKWIDPHKTHPNGLFRSWLLMESKPSGADMETISRMVTELRNRGGFDLGWPTRSAVTARLDRERSTGSCTADGIRLGEQHENANPEQSDGSHLLSLRDASLYEVFFLLAEQPEKDLLHASCF